VKRILFALAHPDDESFGSGGTIARYVAEGAEVTLICATGGEAGTVDPALLAQGETIRDLRQRELRCAETTLGIQETWLLGYRDSGMVGSPDNAHPESFCRAAEQDPESVVRRIAAILRQVRPQVVVTFNRYGGYGHPDHIAIQRMTIRAIEAAAAPDPESGAAGHRVQKLYYTGLPEWPLRAFVWIARLTGRDPRRLGTNADLDLVAVIDHLEPTHARIDVRPFVDIWRAANACHASQGGGGFLARLPLPLRRRALGQQGFTRVLPPPPGPADPEHDLFAGISEA
jgi:LmbE family N-acetylglucosaminyl deacetylase